MRIHYLGVQDNWEQEPMEHLENDIACCGKIISPDESEDSRMDLVKYA